MSVDVVLALLSKEVQLQKIKEIIIASTDHDALASPDPASFPLKVPNTGNVFSELDVYK